MAGLFEAFYPIFEEEDSGSESSDRVERT